jgi:Na+/phosphate symporter
LSSLRTGAFSAHRQRERDEDETDKTDPAERRAAERHIERLRGRNPDTIETSSLHLDVLRDLKRIHSHLVSVAYPLLEASGDLRDSRLAPERTARKSPGRFT